MSFCFTEHRYSISSPAQCLQNAITLWLVNSRYVETFLCVCMKFRSSEVFLRHYDYSFGMCVQCVFVIREFSTYKHTSVLFFWCIRKYWSVWKFCSYNIGYFGIKPNLKCSCIRSILFFATYVVLIYFLLLYYKCK